MSELTDFGDPAILLPLAGLLFLWLAVLISWRAAFHWAAALLFCLLGTASLRLLFHIGKRLDLTSGQIPSGHVSGTTLVYGALALISYHASGNRSVKVAVVLAWLAIVSVVAFSRVALEVHTVGEIISGLTVGLASLAWFAWAYLREKPIPRYWPFVLAGMALLAFLLHGTRVEIWPILEAVATHIGLRPSP